jgi:hypothetical protein
VEELMNKLLISLRSERNQARIMAGVAVVNVVVFVAQMALLLPGILMR